VSAFKLRARILGPLRTAVLRLLHAVLRRPRVKRAALRVLALVPPVEARLHRMLRNTAPGAPPGWRFTPASSDDLPPRAARMLAELRQAMKARQH
jgi:O-antigen chain-terminating methyltransferase